MIFRISVALNSRLALSLGAQTVHRHPEIANAARWPRDTLNAKAPLAKIANFARKTDGFSLLLLIIDNATKGNTVCQRVARLGLEQHVGGLSGHGPSTNFVEISAGERKPTSERRFSSQGKIERCCERQASTGPAGISNTESAALFIAFCGF